MNKFHHILWDYFTPLCLTSITAWELTENTIWSTFFYIVSALAAIVCVFIFAKQRNNAIIGILSALILGMCTFWHQWLSIKNEETAIIWNQSLSNFPSQREADIEHIVTTEIEKQYSYKQVELANYYYSIQDYQRARILYEKSANNGCPNSLLDLFFMNLRGIGCPVDSHQAVQNLLRANQLGAVKNEDFINLLSSIQVSISEEDSILLDKRISDAEVTQRIRSDALKQIKTFGLPAFSSSISKSRHVLENLSRNGFLPATELLYASERLSDKPSAFRLHLYAKMMYDGGFIPTLPFERVEFLNNVFFHSKADYMDAAEVFYRLHTNPICARIAITQKGVCLSEPIKETVEDCIRRHYYPTIGENGNNIDFSSLSDDELLLMYRYFQSQYEYCARFIKGSLNNRLNLVVSFGPNYEESYSISKIQLEQCASEIFNRTKLLHGIVE